MLDTPGIFDLCHCFRSRLLPSKTPKTPSASLWSYQADKDGNEKIDFSEFSKLWVAIRGEGEVESKLKVFW